ncbi:MAG TPA: hypothetical protein VMF13_14825, partial [Luteitalea sp.]|nr:hypothetical protein [Luteitalea sp.]
TWLSWLLLGGGAASGMVLLLLSLLGLANGVRRAFNSGARAAAAATRHADRVEEGTPADAGVLVWITARLPDLLAIAVLGLSLWLVIRLQRYLWHFIALPVTTGVLTADRFFSLDSLLSPLPQLGSILALSLMWVTWSLRTLYYQSIPAPDAAGLVEGLTGYDCADRRLTRNILSTLDTTMQPTGWFAVVALVAVGAFCILGVPRTYTLEGAPFRSVLIVGMMLAVLAISLELGQASWLAVQVKRLLERVRIHPVYPALVALKDAPVDWRPALQQPQSPHRLLLRLLVPKPEPLELERAGRVPILRTHAWRVALREAADIAQYLLTERRFRWSQPEDEPLLALVTAVFLQTLVTRVVRGFGISVLLIMVLIAGHLITAFPGRSIAVVIDVGLLVAAALLSIRVLFTFERDHVLSTLWNGTPGALNLSSGLVWRAALYGGLPVVTIVCALFPEVGGGALTLLEPLRQLLPAQ